MNTKQLWQALANNSVSYSFFDGIFSRDLLKNITKKPSLIICNTDPSYKEGKHWIAIFFTEEYVEFYDSIGKDIVEYHDDLIRFISKFNVPRYKISLIKTQEDNTSYCGEHCLFYSYYRCKGKSMEYIIDLMTKSDVVRFVHSKFEFCKESECKYVQICKECIK